MNMQEFIVALADVEGNEATQKFVKDFWEQASDEDRAAIVLGVDQMRGHLRKVVKSFWAFCGIHIDGTWVSFGGVSYAINPHQHAKSLNVDFEGVTPGVDQLLYDQANEKARDQPQHKFRLTDDHGGRGVTCEVLPDDQMPLDKNGNRVEIVRAGVIDHDATFTR